MSTTADYVDLPDLDNIYVTMSVVCWSILFLEVLLMAPQDPLRIYEALKGSHWLGGVSGGCMDLLGAFGFSLQERFGMPHLTIIH